MIRLLHGSAHAVLRCRGYTLPDSLLFRRVSFRRPGNPDSAVFLCLPRYRAHLASFSGEPASAVDAVDLPYHHVQRTHAPSPHNTNRHGARVGHCSGACPHLPTSERVGGIIYLCAL